MKVSECKQIDYVWMHGKNGQRAMMLMKAETISTVGSKRESFYHEHMHVIHQFLYTLLVFLELFVPPTRTHMHTQNTLLLSLSTYIKTYRSLNIPGNTFRLFLKVF